MLRSIFVDIHTHILPGLDDGAKNVEQSIAIARSFQDLGIKKVVATPHFIPGTAWATPKEKILETVTALQDRLCIEEIDLGILPGMEIAFHKKMVDRILAGSLLPLGTSGYYLIEPSFQGGQSALLEALQKLLDCGKKCIVAHPERVEGFTTYKGLKKLVDQGLRIQVNSGSILGYFGKKCRGNVLELAKQNCIHYIASDVHDIQRRPVIKESEWQILRRGELTAELFESCIHNSKALFDSNN